MCHMMVAFEQMKCYNRRKFLSSIAATSVPAGAASTSVTASGESAFRGQLVDHQADPISNRQITLGSRNDGHHELTTDDDGRFEQKVSSGTTYRFGFYRYKYGAKPTEPAGVPHVCSLGRHTAEDGETDLGTLSVGKSHLVEVQAIDSDENPLGGLSAELYAKGEEGDYWGTGPGTLSTNHQGYVVVDDGAYTGMELADSVEFSISLPNGDNGDVEYTREFFVEEPMSITAQVGEGMTVNSTDDANTTTTNATTTENTTTKQTTEETGTTSTQTSSTESTTSEERNTASGTTKTSTTGQLQTTNTTGSEPDYSEQKRGFLSNGSANDFEMMNDPFVLTVGGFVLSAGGIVYQLLRGR